MDPTERKSIWSQMNTVKDSSGNIKGKYFFPILINISNLKMQNVA